jgi:hypothetical protein
MFSFFVLEKRCPVCKDRPRAKKASRRSELDRVPSQGTLARCYMAFVKNIAGCEAPTKHSRRRSQKNILVASWQLMGFFRNFDFG